MLVSVTGENTINIDPERADLHLSAGFESDDKRQVVEATVDLVTTLSKELDVLTGPGGQATRYTVGSMQTRSWRPENDLGQVMPQRHSAGVHLSVRFDDFNELSRFASGCATRHGITLHHVEWRLTEKTMARVQETATAAAAMHARTRALTVAKTYGFTYVMPNEVADPGMLVSGPHGIEALPMTMMRASTAPVTGGEQIDPDVIDLRPEEIAVTAVVHCRFTAG